MKQIKVSMRLRKRHKSKLNSLRMKKEDPLHEKVGCLIAGPGFLDYRRTLYCLFFVKNDFGWLQGNVWWLAGCLQAMERGASQSPNKPMAQLQQEIPTCFKYACMCVYHILDPLSCPLWKAGSFPPPKVPLSAAKSSIRMLQQRAELVCAALWRD